MAPTRVAELTSMIAEHTAHIDNYLASQGLPTPSFDANAPPDQPFPDSVAASREIVLGATDELHSLILGPIGLLTYPYVCSTRRSKSSTTMWLTQCANYQHNHFISLHAIYRFDIASSFPEGQDEASYDEIARACGLSEPDTRRILRSAMTHHIFRESRKGIVAHTTASKMLAVNPSMRGWVGMVLEDMWPSAAQGFNIAFDTQEPLFTVLAKNPSRAQRFAEAMSYFSTGGGYEPQYLLDNYPWASLGKATVVDVGGSYGSVSIALAQQFPSLRCVVQDRPEVVVDGPARIPPELTDRVSFQPHDFFTDQPIKGADIYFFRWIFHDWSDKYSIKILRCLIPALKRGARIVINEYLLPEPGVLSAYTERGLRAFDLAMLELQNAKEREEGDWAQLFRDADPRFRFVGVKQPPFSKLGIIEAAWEG
ncbi:MAG: hypothetical protein Q9187_000003 [Circinaria calcarea]